MNTEHAKTIFLENRIKLNVFGCRETSRPATDLPRGEDDCLRDKRQVKKSPGRWRSSLPDRCPGCLTGGHKLGTKMIKRSFRNRV